MRVVTITLGFVPARIWAQSCAAYYETANVFLPVEHYFIDQHYPINKAQNSAELREICDKYGVKVLDPGRNMGLHHGFNWALEQIKVQPEDIVIAYDPDVNPISLGWDMALVTALQNAPDVVWASLMMKPIEEDIIAKGFRARKIAHLEAWEPNAPVMNSICAWRGKFLSGGLQEPNAFYGGLECSMWNILKANKWAWVFLTGWWEDQAVHVQQDESYKNFKWAHAHLQSWRGDFETFLAAGCPMPEEPPRGFGRTQG